MKVIIGILWTAFCTVLGCIPEAVIYGCYHFVSPTSEIAKVVLALGLGYFGLGFCFLAAVLAFALWATGLAAIIEA